jgi:hypothetical protein
MMTKLADRVQDRIHDDVTQMTHTGASMRNMHLSNYVSGAGRKHDHIDLDRRASRPAKRRYPAITGMALVNWSPHTCRQG